MEEAKDVLAYVANGYANRSVVYCGLRRVGKAVLLSEIENFGQENQIYYEHIEALENGSFMSSISLYVSKLLSKMSVVTKVKQYVELAKSVTTAFQLIHKGFIYATNRGEISFTVPQFEQYLKRVYGI